MKPTLLRKLKRYAKIAGDAMVFLYKTLIAPIIVGLALFQATTADTEPARAETEPVEDPYASSEIQQIGTRLVVTGDGLRVRIEPNFKGVILGQLPINSRVISTREDGDWYFIDSYEIALSGWVHRDYVVTEGHAILK